MSMRTSMVYGYGFETHKITDEDFLVFLYNHKDAFCESDEEKLLFDNLTNLDKYYDDLDDNITDDYFESYCCDSSGQQGRGAVISNIIYRETGIRVEYQMGDYDCYSYPSVLFPECMPWHLNEKEKNLTMNSLKEILLPYVTELGLNKENITSLQIEYFG